MPADIKSAPVSHHSSLQGANFTPKNEAERIEAIDQAFNYRGDVTLTLSTGEKVEGYISNRNADARPPRLEIFPKTSEALRIIPYSDVTAVEFTGKDTADGKSWEAWVNKKETERKAEADRIKAEAEAQGHL